MKCLNYKLLSQKIENDLKKTIKSIEKISDKTQKKLNSSMKKILIQDGDLRKQKFQVHLLII